MGLSCPHADTGVLLRYTMGESVCTVAGLRPELVGQAVPVAVVDPAERGACLSVVLRVGAPPSLQGSTPEVILTPPASAWVLVAGYTIQTLRDGPLPVFLLAAAPPDLLGALDAFFPVEEAPQGDQSDDGDGNDHWAKDQHLGLELVMKRTTRTSYVSHPPPPPSPASLPSIGAQL